LGSVKYQVNILDRNTKVWPVLLLYIYHIYINNLTLFFQIFIISTNNFFLLIFIIRTGTLVPKYSRFPQDLFSQCRTTLLGWTAFIVLFLGSNLIFMSTQMITFYA